MLHRFRVAVMPLLLLAAVPTSPAQAQTAFPERPIKLIVPLAAGGGGDIVGRLIAARMQPSLGQPVVVENRAGGATVIGTDLVAKAQADGYTLVLATSSHVINGSLVKLPFDPVKDFAGVSLVATSPLMLAVNPKRLTVNSLRELVDLAKSRPEGLTFGSSGVGSLPHLSGEMLARSADIKLIHVAYKGSAPAEADLLGGQIDMYFGSPSSLLPHVRAGTLRMLVSTGGRRSGSFPETPTLSETYPSLAAETFYTILAPAATPPAALQRLHAAVRHALETPGTRERLNELGADVVGSAPAETLQYIDIQVRQWERVVKAAGIKAD